MTQPVTERSEGAPAGYTLRFPDSWWHLDLDPSTRDASIRRRIESQVKKAPQLSREQVDALIRSTRRIAREAHAQGALRASGMLRILPAGSGPLVLSATTAVLRISVPEGQAEDLADLVVAAGMQLGTAAEGTGLPPGEVELVELPHVGAAGRISRIEDVDHQGKPVPTAMRHTLIPVPNSRDYLVLASSTPNVDLADQFYEVFDAIAESFRFEDPAGTSGAADPAAEAAGGGPMGEADKGK
ncbi:hypothetical protein RB199_27250 [Streptomyces libani]|uniref:Uncharacterized protein n=1 Tax=Streptomyces nigrescens TaxID=1920 RepID=A0A640TIG4_STRNI|nr:MULTISPECIES: hypothetical protein [Streptomyces]MYX07806.1 hypothetical protein [Streptomyces sp. SID8375]WAT98064.1 hypothetical protein STRLI_004073 [Streptomyces libani subsp. libani]GFE23633.1 hypothetical protein Sliba_40860 [Streptomyces libani subsp. libani]GGV93574.1 hypothetical protein GCM10010500_29550 [Streptomyces libani subsp. libani]